MFETKKRFLLALYRLEESMQAVLEKLERMEMPPSVGCTDSSPAGGAAPAGDAWLQSGIDSILSYQVGGKKSEKEGEQA